MLIDLKLLTAVAEERDRARLSRGTRAAGPMAAFRLALPTIEKLRGQGVAWSSIAAAFDQAGVRRADGKVLDGKYAAAMYSTYRARENRKAIRRAEKDRYSVAARSARSDLTKLSASTAEQPAPIVKLAGNRPRTTSALEPLDQNDPVLVKARIQQAQDQSASKFFKVEGNK